jgi:CDP-glucose 4,6-dehydratase
MGSWLVQRLIQEGADVVALVKEGHRRNNEGETRLMNRVTTVHGRVEDIDLIRRSLAEYAIDTVFHLAAQAIVINAKLDPVLTFETNIKGTWNMLEAAQQCGVRQFVMASSDKAYGPSPNLPYLETHPLRGTNPYDVSKSCADLISTMYAKTYRLPMCVVRCANLFGGGDLNFSRTIPGVIQATLKGEPFVIRSDGKFVREFLYVKDAATAYLRVAEALAADRSLTGEAFNFGTGARLTTLELADMVLRTLGRPDLKPIVQNQPSVEVKEQYLSSEKARTALGWIPQYTFAEGLAETIDWYRNYLEDGKTAHAYPAAN